MAARDRDGGRWGKLLYSLSGDGVPHTSPSGGNSLSHNSRLLGAESTVTSPHEKLLPTSLKGREPPPGGGGNSREAINYVMVADQAAPAEIEGTKTSVRSKSTSLIFVKQSGFSKNKGNGSTLHSHTKSYIQEQPLTFNSNVNYDYQEFYLNTNVNFKRKILNQSQDFVVFDYDGGRSNTTGGTDNLHGSDVTVSLGRAAGSRVSVKRNRSASFAAPPTAVATPSVSQSQHWRDIKTAFSIDSDTGTIYVIKVSALHRQYYPIINVAY